MGTAAGGLAMHRGGSRRRESDYNGGSLSSLGGSQAALEFAAITSKPEVIGFELSVSCLPTNRDLTWFAIREAQVDWARLAVISQQDRVQGP